MDALIELLLTKFWDSLPFWRGTAIALLLLLMVAWATRNRLLRLLSNPERLDYDRAIFLRFDAVMSEPQLRRILLGLGGEHSLSQESFNNIVGLAHFFDDTSNSHLSKQLARKSLVLTKALTNLERFLGLNFDLYPPDSEARQLRMHPELKGLLTRDDERYEECARKLISQIGAVEKLYREYRKAVKEELVL